MPHPAIGGMGGELHIAFCVEDDDISIQKVFKNELEAGILVGSTVGTVGGTFWGSGYGGWIINQRSTKACVMLRI